MRTSGSGRKTRRKNSKPNLPNNLVERIAHMMDPPNRWRIAHASKTLQNRMLSPSLKAEAMAHTLTQRLERVLTKAVVHYQSSLQGNPKRYIPLSLKFDTFKARLPGGTLHVSLFYDATGIFINIEYPSLSRDIAYRVEFTRATRFYPPNYYEYINGKGIVYPQQKRPTFSGDWSVDLVLTRLDTMLRQWARTHGLKFTPGKRVRFSTNAGPSRYPYQ